MEDTRCKICGTDKGSGIVMNSGRFVCIDCAKQIYGILDQYQIKGK